jgi:hypothetical protein
MKQRRISILLIILFVFVLHDVNSFAQAEDFTAVSAGVFFDQPLRDWDGFGFNYVQCAHSASWMIVGGMPIFWHQTRRR